MIASISVLLFTFILTIIDKFFLNEKSDHEEVKTNHNFVYRIIKSKYTLLILIFGLLVFQVSEAFRNANIESKRDTTASNTLTQVSETYNKVLETSLSIDNLLKKINTTLKITENELLLMSNVNNEIKNVRNGIDNNIFEFNSIKTQYEKQIKIEQGKIENAKPALQAIFAKSIIDSLTFNYQFQLINNGLRTADSVIYYSLMVFIGPNNQSFTVDLYKTNRIGSNVLSIPGKDTGLNTYYISSNQKVRKELTTFIGAVLLIKFKYIDSMTSKSYDDFKIFICQSLEKGNQQYGTLVPKEITEWVKNYLLSKNKEYYEIFFTH
jgi:hypothetical protein